MLSVVLPTRNDRHSVELLVYTLLAILEEPTGGEFELLVVDDSNDGSDAYLAEKLKRWSKVKVWHREKGTGLATAIGDGIERCRHRYVLLMDADFNHDPLELPKMLAAIRLGGWDVVSGSRFLPGGGMPGHALRNLGSSVFNLFVRRSLGLETTDMLAGFWIMGRERVLELKRRWEIFYGYGDYYIRFLYACRLAGMKVQERPVQYLKRLYGESGTNFRKELVRYTKTVMALRRERPDIEKRLAGWR